MLNLKDKIKLHIETFERLSDIEQELNQASKLIKDCCLDGKTVFSCGNGGSAADAQHFSAELTGRYLSDRQPMAGIALTVDTSAITAIGNDYSFDDIFSRPLKALGKKGDILLAISTSGNSKNIIKTVQVAKEKGIKVIGLLGRDGGELKNMVDTAVIVPSEITANIQEAHIFILHYFCEHLE